MTTTAEFLRDVLDTTGLSDPREVAAELMRRIPDEARAEVLSEVLSSWVQRELSRRRMLSPAGIPYSPFAGSPKVAAVRSDWEARLATPLLVRGSGWKRLRDCTRADLVQVAEDLRIMASHMTAKADYYDDLARHVPEGGTVGQLAADPIEAAA